MSSIIEDLQGGALDPAVRTSDLLLKALVVASKLGLGEFETWVRQELNGYAGAESSAPEYRRSRGQLRAWSPYYGWQPILFEDEESEEALCHQLICLPISEIEQLHRQIERSEGGELHVDLSSQQQLAIRHSLDEDSPIAVTTFIPATSPGRILDAVRGTIVNWALDLESKGVRGDNLSFSRQEHAAAAATSGANHYFFGALEKIPAQALPHGPARIFYVRIDLEEVAKLVATLRDVLEWIQLSAALREELRTDIDTMDVQLGSSQPKRGIIRTSLYSTRRILESAIGENPDRPLRPLVAQIGAALGS